MIAFTALQQNKTMLWVRALDSAEARVIPGTEQTSQAFWSPDSRSLAFFDTNTLRRVELAGGPAQEICAVSIPMGGGSWSRNGVIVFSPRPEGVLFRVPAAGGTPQPVTALDHSRGELAHRSPEFLPDGRHFLYVASSGKPGGTAVRVGSIDSMDSRFYWRRPATLFMHHLNLENRARSCSTSKVHSWRNRSIQTGYS